MIITGYLLENTTDVCDIDNVLFKVRKNLEKYANKKYGKLIGEETALICDNLTLNVLTRNNNVPIIQVAKENVDKRIRIAGATGASNDYNMNVYARIMCHDGNTYIEVSCPNKQLLKAFKNVGLEEFHLSEAECKDERNHKTMIWQKLHAIYKNAQPMSLNLSVHPELNEKEVEFPSVGDRAGVFARHSITTRLLNQLSGGEQIPPHLLMPYMDMALEQISNNEDIVREMNEKTMHLKQVLLNLDEQTELIFGKKEDLVDGNA